jgi:hypothetical protein
MVMACGRSSLVHSYCKMAWISNPLGSLGLCVLALQCGGSTRFNQLSNTFPIGFGTLLSMIFRHLSQNESIGFRARDPSTFNLVNLMPELEYRFPPLPRTSPFSSHQCQQLSGNTTRVRQLLPKEPLDPSPSNIGNS